MTSTPALFSSSPTVSCLASHGCQSGCWNETATPSPTSTPAPAPAPVLTTMQKTGIIIGACLFATLVAAMIFFWLRHRSREEGRREAIRLGERPNVNIAVVVPDPTNPAAVRFVRQIADAAGGGGNMPRLMAAATSNPYDGGRGRLYGPPSYASS